MVDLNSLQKPENVKREGVCLYLNKQADVRHGAQLSAVLYAPLIVHNPGSRLLITNQKARVTCTRSVLGNGYIYVTMASPSQNAIQISHFCSSSTSALWLTH